MSEGTITLASALEKVKGSNLVKKKEGLNDLKHILRHNQSTSVLDTLEDEPLHFLYETLFKVAVEEQSIWLKAKTATTQNAAESRLSSCAHALRLAVELGLQALKLKTVRALIDHVSQMLTLVSGELCMSLALDYAKLFKALLSYQPHVEHLKAVEWAQAAAFCIDTIKTAEADASDREDAVSGAESLSHVGIVNSLSSRSSRSHIRDTTSSQSARSLAKHVTEEMVISLASLTAATNAPLRKHASNVLWALIAFLKGSSAGGKAHPDAFAAINQILAWARTEDMTLTLKTTSQIIRLVRYFWAQKSVTLKNEMSISLLYLRPYILHLLGKDGGPTLRTELSGLLNTMREEYSKRLERDQLHIDDIDLTFSGRSNTSIAVGPLYLRSNSDRAEECWTLVEFLAFLTSVLSPTVDGSESPDAEESVSSRPRKRQKKINELNEIMLSVAIGETTPTRICGLQILLFLTQQKRLHVSLLAKIVDKVSAVCSEDAGNFSAWSLMVVAGCASQVQSTDQSLSSRWSLLWQLGCREMTSGPNCRASCFLLGVMLKLRLVTQPVISELIQTLTLTIDLSGPSMLADSVADLLYHVVLVSRQLNPGTTSATTESILAWTLRNFVPSRFEDKSYAASQTLYLMSDITRLMNVCLDNQVHAPIKSQFSIWGRVAQAWLACKQQHELVSYLLLTSEEPTPMHELLDSANKPYTAPSATQVRQSCEVQVLNHFTTDLHRAQERWNQLCQERASSIGSESFRFLCNACCIMVCVGHCHDFRDTRRQAQLQRQITTLFNSMCAFASNQEKSDGLLLIVSQALPGINQARPDYGVPSTAATCEEMVCCYLAGKLHSGWNQSLDVDEMEIDDGFESQDSHGNGRRVELAASKPRNDAAMEYSLPALRASANLYATLIKLLHDNRQRSHGEK